MSVMWHPHGPVQQVGADAMLDAMTGGEMVEDG